jgi:hypothetical protein
MTATITLRIIRLITTPSASLAAPLLVDIALEILFNIFHPDNKILPRLLSPVEYVPPLLPPGFPANSRRMPVLVSLIVSNIRRYCQLLDNNI